MRLCIIITNYRTPGLVLDVLDSLEGQVEAGLDEIVVVDNDSQDSSAERLERAIAARGMTRYCRVLRAERNGGLAAGNNVGMRAVEANYYLLLNSDTIVRKGAVHELLSQMQEHPFVGIAGPRLEWPDGTPQVSCFRDHTPVSELITAADSAALSGWLRDFQVALPVVDEPREAQWLSFACVLIRREVIEKVGLLDEQYFQHYEDSDYCRAARSAGFRVSYFPAARVVHLQKGYAEPARNARKLKAKKPSDGQQLRPPRHLYAARTRYFRKGYGALGFVAANTLWSVGRCVSLAREVTGKKKKASGSAELQWFDNWTDALRLQP